MIILAFFAFLSGIITILSPCILPVLPIVLSGSVGGKSKPLGIITGFILSFSFFTLGLSFLVQLLNISPGDLRFFAAGVIIVFGIILVVPGLLLGFEVFSSKLIKQNNSKQKKGFGGGVIVGASLGLIWTPCVGPIMASVISLAISQQVSGGAVIIVLAYSLGTSIPMLGIMTGGRSLLNRFPKVLANAARVQRIFGVIMILAGLGIALGLDRQFQGFILETFPSYGDAITSIEDNNLIQQELDKINIEDLQ
jgi:cytochrome c biogenesis protein CcdA